MLKLEHNGKLLPLVIQAMSWVSPCNTYSVHITLCPRIETDSYPSPPHWERSVSNHPMISCSLVIPHWQYLFESHNDLFWFSSWGHLISLSDITSFLNIFSPIVLFSFYSCCLHKLLANRYCQFLILIISFLFHFPSSDPYCISLKPMPWPSDRTPCF